MQPLKIFLAMPVLFAMAVAAAGQAPPPPAPAAREDESGGRIVGGKPALPGSAKWQAEIYSAIPYTDQEIADDRARSADHPDKRFLDIKDEWERVHRCGAVYLGENWVLTAAHCVVRADVLTSRRIRLGTQDLSPRGGGSTYRIERVAIHKDYDPAVKKHDIALLRIAADAKTQRLPAGRLEPIRLLGERAGDRPLASFDRVSVTGWGLTSAKAAGSVTRALDGSILRGSPVLMQLGLQILPQARCEAVSAYRAIIGPGVICAGSDKPGQDACTGDSGGPLTRAQGAERVLVGLVSTGKGCALPGVPGLYTNVSHYLAWIRAARQAAPPGQVSRQ